jgi:hypothetical protein
MAGRQEGVNLLLERPLKQEIHQIPEGIRVSTSIAAQGEKGQKGQQTHE